MPWYIFALLAPAFFGITNFIEKYVLDKHVDDAMTVMIISCFMNGLLGTVLFSFFPALRQIGLWQMFLLMISGAIIVFYALPYYKALQLEDASMVVPLFQFIAVFVLILSAIFLKEYLTIKQIFGLIVIVISGLVLGNDHISKVLKPRKSFWLMMLSCFMVTFSIILFKGVTNKVGFWTGMMYNLIGGGMVGATLLFMPNYRKNVMKVNFGKIGMILLIDDILDMMGRLCYFYATTLTLVTLAELLGSTQSFIVLFYGLFLTLLFPKIIKEDISWKTIKNKLIVGVVMFAGLWLVYF